MNLNFTLFILFILSGFISINLNAKQFEDFTPTGLKNSHGQALYYAKKTNLAEAACGMLKQTVKNDPSTPIGTVCQKSCENMFAPILFTAFIGAVNQGGKWKAAPFESDWQKVFFCGWNPEAGVTAREIKQAGIASQADIDAANLVCDKGKNPNMILVIGGRDKSQCIADCLKCATGNVK